MGAKDYFLRFTHELAYLELKQEACHADLFRPDLPLPIRTFDFLEGLRDDQLDQSIDLSYFLKGMVWNVGIDPDFKYAPEYKEILKKAVSAPDRFACQLAKEAIEEGNPAQLSHGIGAFLLKLCSFSGFRPRVSTCVYGGEALVGDRFFFDAEAGGIACALHAPSVGADVLSGEEYAAIVHYLRLPLRVIMDAHDFSSADARRLARVCFRYYATHTGRHTLGTLSMMEELHLL